MLKLQKKCVRKEIKDVVVVTKSEDIRLGGEEWCVAKWRIAACTTESAWRTRLMSYQLGSPRREKEGSERKVNEHSICLDHAFLIITFSLPLNNIKKIRTSFLKVFQLSNSHYLIYLFFKNIQIWISINKYYKFHIKKII